VSSILKSLIQLHEDMHVLITKKETYDKLDQMILVGFRPTGSYKIFNLVNKQVVISIDLPQGNNGIEVFAPIVETIELMST
jgi:hypothetical protein